MCAQTAKQTVTIKKYANRRLYNTATSSYVTLEDLSAMVKEGCEFNVYDAKSSEDITRSVLTQIIVEEENKTGQQNLLPINFLRQLIGFYGDSLQWMVPKYLEHSMDNLTGNQEQIRDYFQTTLGSIFPFGTTLEEMSKQNMSMFENTLRMFSPMASFEALTNNLGNLSPFSSTTSTANASSTDAANTATTNTASPSNASKSTNDKDSSSSCKTSNKDKSSSSCSVTADSADSKKNETIAQPTASITNLKPRNSNSSNETASNASSNASTTTTTTTTTPMPNVQSATASNNSGADDMQQKIANLQRQLADLAKSRA